jgi:hypothetical protein
VMMGASSLSGYSFSEKILGGSGAAWAAKHLLEWMGRREEWRMEWRAADRTAVIMLD